MLNLHTYQDFIKRIIFKPHRRLFCQKGRIPLRSTESRFTGKITKINCASKSFIGTFLKY